MSSKEYPEDGFSERFKAIRESTSAFLSGDKQYAWDQYTLEQALFWTRFGLSLFLGIVFGLIPITGALGLILYAGLAGLLVAVNASNRLGLSPTEHGDGAFFFFTTGLLSSFSLFLLVWSVVFSNFRL